MSLWTLGSGRSTIGFTVRHMMFSKVHGVFTRWEAWLDVDDADVTRSRVIVRVDASSIDTRDAQRDCNLRSSDFLDVATFPHVTFESRVVVEQGSRRVHIVGPLTVHGVTKDITLDLERTSGAGDFRNEDWLAFKGATTVNRKDFGVVYNPVLETGGVLVSDKIDVSFELLALRAP